MLNIRWGIIAGIAALVLAFATSLLSGHVSLLVAALRSLGFAVLFFALGTGIWAIINTFIPELLIPGEQSSPTANVFSGESSGRRVNITLGEVSDAALPGQDSEAHSVNEVENIGDLVSGKFKPAARHIDQKSANSYNEPAGEFIPMQDIASGGDGGFSMNLDGFSPGGGEMGMLEPLSNTEDFSFTPADSSAFSFGGDSAFGDGMFSDDSPLGGSGEPSPPQRKASGNKPVEFEGDFNPKEIAAGIRTVLDKDK